MYGHKKSRYGTAVCADLLSNLFSVAKVRKVFGMGKGEGRKCVAEHVFCGKRKGSRVGEPWGCYFGITRIFAGAIACMSANVL